MLAKIQEEANEVIYSYDEKLRAKEVTEKEYAKKVEILEKEKMEVLMKFQDDLSQMKEDILMSQKSMFSDIGPYILEAVKVASQIFLSLK